MRSMVHASAIRDGPRSRSRPMTNRSRTGSRALCLVPREPREQMPLHVRALLLQYAVHHAVARAAVAARLVVADPPIEVRGERRDRLLRGEIEIVGAEPH